MNMKQRVAAGEFIYQQTLKCEGDNMNKCEWKDGEISFCCIMADNAYRHYGQSFGKNPLHCSECGASLKKPVEIKVGMFGKFENDESYTWDILTEINNTGTFDDNNYGAWDNFTPGLPEGFNQDGTIKEIDK